MNQACKYVYIDDHHACGMPASPDSDFCVWHNTQLNKSDVYVAELLGSLTGILNRDMTEFHLSELDWPGAQLSQTLLNGVDLRDGHLPRAQLEQASLVNANLRRCNLRKANLFRANLSGCDLKHTDLNGADLREANLSGAQLSDTNLLNADLSGANFSNVKAESFRWNELTNFDNIVGLDARESKSDETQAFITPIALAHYQKKKNQSSSLARKDQIPQTHEYRNASSINGDTLDRVANVIKTTFIAKEQSPKELPPSLTKSIANFNPYKKRIRLLSIATAAAILLTITASTFGVLALRELQNRPVIEKEVIVTKDVYIQNPNTPEVTESIEYKQLLQQHQDVVDHNKTLSEAYRKFELSLKQAEQHKVNEENVVVRLQMRNDELELRLDEYTKLQQRYQDLKRHTSRLNDTASILAKGVENLSAENEELNEIKNTRLNAKSQLELLQTKTLQLQHENDQLKKDHTETEEYNKTLTAELDTARKALERFLSRIEGSHLHAFLTKDAGQLKAISVTAGKPIVLSGDHLITLEVKPSADKKLVESKLFIQRSGLASIPDVNIIFYNAQMEPLRSVSYGFPNSDTAETFAISSASFNCPTFPSFVRILVNPSVEGELVASNSANSIR